MAKIGDAAFAVKRLNALPLSELDGEVGLYKVGDGVLFPCRRATDAEARNRCEKLEVCFVLLGARTVECVEVTSAHERFIPALLPPPGNSELPSARVAPDHALAKFVEVAEAELESLRAVARERIRRARKEESPLPTAEELRGGYRGQEAQSVGSRTAGCIEVGTLLSYRSACGVVEGRVVEVREEEVDVERGDVVETLGPGHSVVAVYGARGRRSIRRLGKATPLSNYSLDTRAHGGVTPARVFLRSPPDRDVLARVSLLGGQATAEEVAPLSTYLAARAAELARCGYDPEEHLAAWVMQQGGDDWPIDVSRIARDAPPADAGQDARRRPRVRPRPRPSPVRSKRRRRKASAAESDDEAEKDEE